MYCVLASARTRRLLDNLHQPTVGPDAFGRSRFDGTLAERLYGPTFLADEVYLLNGGTLSRRLG